MLRKLLKYELKSTSRILLPLYSALLVFAFILKIFIGSKLDGVNMDFLGGIPAVISIFTYGATMAAVFIVTIFIIIQRFYKNLLGDEGYLMNTLPVSINSNICSKLIAAIFWSLVSIFIAGLSILIMVYSPDLFKDFWPNLSQTLSEINSRFGFSFPIIAIEFILASLFQLALNITIIYASISIGHLLPKMKILGSFGAFIVLNIIMNTVVSTIALLSSTIYYKHVIGIISTLSPVTSVHLFAIACILINAFWLVIYFVITRYILKNKLNLE